MILHAEQRQVAVPQAFQSRIVQIHVREFDFAIWQRIRIDGEVMVVRRDLDLPRCQLLHRMISAVMSKLELKSFPAEGDAGELMSETDAKDGLASHEAANRVDRIRTRLGIPRPIRQKHSIRFQREDIFRQSLRWNHCHSTTLTA